jgi:hypothetical protein
MSNINHTLHGSEMETNLLLQQLILQTTGHHCPHYQGLGLLASLGIKHKVYEYILKLC